MLHNVKKIYDTAKEKALMGRFSFYGNIKSASFCDELYDDKKSIFCNRRNNRDACIILSC